MKPRKSILSRYSKKTVNPNFYAPITITGSSVLTGSTSNTLSGLSTVYVYAPYIMSPISGSTFASFPDDTHCPHCCSDDWDIAEAGYICDVCGKEFIEPVTKKEYIKLSRNKKLKRIMKLETEASK